MSALYNINSEQARHALQDASCVFGVFDGVHTGHQFLLDQARATSHDATGTVVLTFDIDPEELLCPQEIKKIQSNEMRLNMLASLGVDAVVVLPFTQEFASLSPDEFLQTVFAPSLPRFVHVGSDIRFGFKGAGHIADLQHFGQQAGMSVVGHPLLCVDDAPVSSSRIRALLAQGHIEEAEKLLGHRYALDGIVEKGRGQGSDFGFRTANLSIDTRLLTLGEGVYAAYAYVNQQRYRAAVSVGVSPVFEKNTTANIEVHILDFDDDIYHTSLRVEFLTYLRPMMKFDNIDKLIETVQGNIAWVRDNIAIDGSGAV